jgi:hypothetical protein
MFDDAEAALDGLLGQAAWETPDPQLLQRLTALVQEQPVLAHEQACEQEVLAHEQEELAHEQPDLVYELPKLVHKQTELVDEQPQLARKQEQLPVTWDSGPCPDLDPRREARVTDRPPLPLRSARSVQTRAFKFIAAMAACVILAMGLAWMLVRSITRPDPVPVIASNLDLPGRPATPMELWLISPSGQKYLATRDQPTTPPDPREAQLQALCRTGDATTLAAALPRQEDERARRLIVQSLLTCPGGAERYLNLVLNRATRAPALASVRELSPQVSRALLASLDDPSMARRFAAAKALGNACQGDLLPTLRQMIQSGDHRREALAVLSECDDVQAIAYLNQIRRDPSLASQIASVRTEMSELF